MNFNKPISSIFNRRLLIKLQIPFIFIFLGKIISGQQPQLDIKQLSISQKTERKIANQELHAYVIEIKRDQVLKVNIQEKGADVIAYIARLDGQKETPVSAISSSGNGFMQESVTATIEQDGTYRLVIRAVQTDQEVNAQYEFIASLTNSITIPDLKIAEAEKYLEEASQVTGTNNIVKIPGVISNLERGVKTWQILNDKYWEAVTKLWIGNLHAKLGDFNKAEASFIQALNLLDKTKYKAEMAVTYFSLAGIYNSTKNEANAKLYLKNAGELFKIIGDKRFEKITGTADTSNLNSLQIDKDNKIKITDFENDLKNAKGRNDKTAQISIWVRVAMENVLGEEKDDNSPTINTQNYSAYSKQLLEKARAYQVRKRKLYERIENEGLTLAKELKDKKAEMQILIALGIGYSDLESDQVPNSNINEEELNPNLEKAKNYLIQGLAISKILKDQVFECFAYAGLSGLYYGEEMDELSIFFGKKFINSIHSFRRTFVNLADRETQQYIAKQTEQLYELLAVIQIEQSRLEEALQTLNFGRDQEFFDFKLVDTQTISKLSMTLKEDRNEKEFDVFLNSFAMKYGNRFSANYQLASMETKNFFDKLEENFDEEISPKEKVATVPDAESMKSALHELSAKTGKNHVSIYHFGSVEKDEIYLLLVTPTVITAYSGEKSDEDILEFLELLKSPNWDTKDLGNEIYKGIFKAEKQIGEDTIDISLEKDLENANAQVIHWSLSGKMRYIPIAALFDAERQQYLVEQYENVVFTRPKKESFLIPPKRWERGVGFGTSIEIPNFPNSALPNADDELYEIFGNPATQKRGFFSGPIFLDRTYTRQSFLTIQQSKPDFVHIASHFKFELGNAGNSFLPLIDGSNISLIDLQLNYGLFEGVDLLTLSACETAVQKADANGKEIDGLAELAQRLGAKSVLASLWKVSDDGTSRLMMEFYRLKQENPEASKAEILRLAQMTLLNGENSWDEGLKNRLETRGIGNKPVETKAETKKEYPKVNFRPSPNARFAHPYYWAPFVLYGGSNGGKTTKTYNIPKPPAKTKNNNPGTIGAIASTATNSASVAGTWSGKYICTQGVTGVTLKLEQNGNNLQGIFEFYPLPENPNYFKPGSGFYRGTFNPSTGAMIMNGERWITQPEATWILVGFSGNFDQSRQVYTGRMMSANCGGIELKKQDSSFAGIFSPPTPIVTLSQIESSFKSSLYDETIRLANIFLQTEPDNKDAITYLGYSYLLKRDVANAVNYLEKAVKLGQPVTIPVKRLRIPIVGHAFDDINLVVAENEVAIAYSDTIYLAKYSELTDLRLNNYVNNYVSQCGTVFLKGVFTEIQTKSEKRKQDKKQFDLFPRSSSLLPTYQGNMMVNRATCTNQEDFIITTLVSLMSRLAAR